jgi:hypothetical protein
MKYFGHIKHHEGLEKRIIETGIYQGGGRDQKGDGFRISQTNYFILANLLCLQRYL